MNSQQLNAKNDRFYLSIQERKASDSVGRSPEGTDHSRIECFDVFIVATPTRSGLQSASPTAMSPTNGGGSSASSSPSSTTPEAVSGSVSGSRTVSGSVSGSVSASASASTSTSTSASGSGSGSQSISTSGSGSAHRIDFSLMDLDTIPDYDEFTQRTPPMQDLSGSVLENPTAIFNLDFHRGRAEALGEVDISPFEEEDDLNYIRDIETTITNTWLILYSTIIRILNILVNLSLSYEKHSLSILRAFSIIALVVCCK